MIEFILFGLVIGLLVAVVVYFAMRSQLNQLRRILKTEFELEWKKREKQIAKSAVDRSRKALKGLIAEHMAPLMRGVFDYELSDARFIGDPIDYLILDGYTEVCDGDSDAEITIVLADCKAGPKARLTPE